MPSPSKAEQALAIIEKFIKDNEINCAETIHQTDWVITNAYGFIEELCEVVGYAENEEKD